MRRLLDALFLLLAAAAAVLVALPRLGTPPAGGAAVGGAAGTVFHAGKAPVPPPPERCGGTGCHGGAPHRAGGGAAALRNLHGGKVECLACHDSAGTSAIVPGRDGYLLSSRGGGGGSTGDPHAGTRRGGPGCRDCHSREGEEALRRAGVTGLSSSFSDPMALRMTEGGARKW